MSNISGPSPPSPPAPPPQQQRSGCATAFMGLFGLALLFPGLCTAVIAVSALKHETAPGLFLLVALGLALAFGGVMLIRAAIRRDRS